MTIKRELSEVDGVTSVDADEETKMVAVAWENPATWEKIAETLKEAGYPAE
jgi:copper chaperone CopZ